MREIVFATAAVIRSGKRYLVDLRSFDDAHGGLWEFPGGKLDWGEAPRDCLVRELSEELGIKASVGKLIDIISHVYPNGRQFIIAFYECETDDEPMPMECERVEWMTLREIGELDLLDADRLILGTLAEAHR